MSTEDGLWLVHMLASADTKSLKKVGLFLEEDRSMSNMVELLEARPSYIRILNESLGKSNAKNDTAGYYQAAKPKIFAGDVGWVPYIKTLILGNSGLFYEEIKTIPISYCVG